MARHTGSPTLAVRAAEEIGRQIAPHKVVRIIPYSFSDAKLQKLLQNRAYMAAEQYALRSIRTALGAEVAAKVEPLMSYGKPKYEVKSSPAADMEAVSGDEKSAAAAAEKLAAKRGCAEALFALGICQEAGGRAEEALYTYRYVFQIHKPVSGLKESFIPHIHNVFEIKTVMRSGTILSAVIFCFFRGCRIKYRHVVVIVKHFITVFYI